MYHMREIDSKKKKEHILYTIKHLIDYVPYVDLSTFARKFLIIFSTYKLNMKNLGNNQSGSNPESSKRSPKTVTPPPRKTFLMYIAPKILLSATQKG